MAKLTQKDAAIIAGLIGAVDMLTEHRFSIPIERAIRKHFAKGAVRAPATALGVARGLATGIRFVAVSHPILTAGAVAYVAIKHREEIVDLVQQGYSVVQPVVEPAVSGILDITAPGRQQLIEGIGARPITARLTKRPSKFNKAVKAGMKAVKDSKYYGKKGTFNNSRKAFAAVTKIASKLTKGQKVSRTGSSGVIARAIPKYLTTTGGR